MNKRGDGGQQRRKDRRKQQQTTTPKRDPQGVRVQVGEIFDLELSIDGDQQSPSRSARERLYGILQGVGALMLRDLAKHVFDTYLRGGHP